MKIEPLKLLSYSYNQELHLCPRKFEIKQHFPIRIATPTIDAVPITEEDGNVDFAYGHCVHAGVQRLFLDQNLDMAIWEAFLAWNIPMWMTRKSKSIWTALDAIHKAVILVTSLKSSGWEIVRLKNNKPSIEINFLVHLPDGYKYQGHIDLILKNIKTGEFQVFEIKTTTFTNVDESMYGNSTQPLGYSVILDVIAPKQTSYKVVYLIFSEAKAGRQWTIMPFMKSKTQKAEWLRDILADKDQIEYYKNEGFFPKRGEGCYAFFRQCQYYGACNLPLKALNPMIPPEESAKADRGREEKEYDYEFTFEDLVANQLEIGEM